MVWFLAAFGLILHVYYWGAALAVWLLPRKLERLWLLFAPLAGLALQTVVVYVAGFFPSLAGTDEYGRAALVIPTALGALWYWRRGRADARLLLQSAGRSWPLWLAQAAVLIVLISPIAGSGLPLTSLSLGSCDAADYGAGARVFQEFSSADRTGFLGQAEVVQVGDSKDFRTVWMRLNHFTPAAALALFGSVASLRSYETVTLFSATLPVLIMPVVFLLFRRVMRFNRFGACAGAAAVGASPVFAYAVYHAAAAQMLATLAVTGLTWAAVRGFEVARHWGGLWRWSGVMAAAFVLLLGSYNFFVIAAPAPAAGWVLWRAWRMRAPARLLRWMLWMAGCGIVAGAILPGRVIGIVERFQLFAQYDYGWEIAGLRPDGWMGAVTAPHLLPATGGLLLAACVLLLATAGMWLLRLWRRDPQVLSVLALAAAPLLGYGILLPEAASTGNNASYDAFKLLGVFLPIVVGALSPWLRAPWQSPAIARAGVVALGAMLVVVNVVSTRGFASPVRLPPLVVSDALADIQSIEDLAEVDAVNLRLERVWPRLWANAFLLKKTQYFAEPTYEGRRPTPLLAGFDLRNDFFQRIGPKGLRPIWASGSYVLIDRRAGRLLAVAFGDGWYSFERHHGHMWRWGQERSEIRIAPRDGRAVRVAIAFDVRAVRERDLFVEVDGREIWRGNIGSSLSRIELPAFAVAPEGSVLAFGSHSPPGPPAPGDPRSLLVAVYGGVIERLDPKESSLSAIEDRRAPDEVR
ncbi:MAG: hypothetical protein ACREIA_00485 [Opitutaceae bacterium]